VGSMCTVGCPGSLREASPAVPMRAVPSLLGCRSLSGARPGEGRAHTGSAGKSNTTPQFLRTRVAVYQVKQGFQKFEPTPASCQAVLVSAEVIMADGHRAAPWTGPYQHCLVDAAARVEGQAFN